MKKRKLIWHLYPSFLIITLLALFAVTWYISYSFRTFYHKQVTHDLEVRARLVEYQMLPFISAGRFSEVDNMCKSLGAAASTRITVILPNGTVIGDSHENPATMKDHSNRPEFITALNGGVGRSSRFSDTIGKNMMYLAIPVKGDNKILAVVRTSVSVTIIDEELNSFYSKVFGTGVIIAVCAAVISWFISRKISLPIEQMKETAKSFAEGKFDNRLTMSDTAEFAELANAMNEMAEQLNIRINTITSDRNQTQAILSSMIEGVLAVDSHGNIVSINNTAADFLDVDAIKVQGLGMEEVIHNPEMQQFIKNTLQNKQPTEGSVWVQGDGGRFLQFHGTSLSNSKGQKSGAVIVLNDITRIHQLEEVRRDFVANVSHELKTPVTSIKGFVETLLEGAVNDPAEAKKFLKIIAKHSDRLDAIIDDLLSLSRLEEDGEKRRLSFENVPLRPVLASAIELSSVKVNVKNIIVELVCDIEVTAKINSPLIEQAVLNLIDNAVKYSPVKSKVTVIAKKLENEVLITVCDEGCGIEKQHLSRIFERFYVVDKGRSRKLGGTGLGLSIVKHISQVHSGYVTVESTLEKGSCFTIHLPAD